MKKNGFKWYTPFKYVYDRYLIQAMGSMALGLFASLIIGLILSQIAKVPGLALLVTAQRYWLPVHLWWAQPLVWPLLMD